MMFCICVLVVFVVFFFKQKTAYEMRISDWSSDVCSSDLWLYALKRPENRDEDHAQHPEDQVKRQPDLDEVTEAIASGAVHHGVGLIAHGSGEAGRDRKSVV